MHLEDDSIPMPGFWPALISILDTLASETRAPFDLARSLTVSGATMDIHVDGHRERLAVTQWWFATRLFYTERFFGFEVDHSIEQLKYLTLAFVVFLAISTANVVHRFIPPTQLLMLRLFVPFMLYVVVFVLLLVWLNMFT